MDKKEFVSKYKEMVSGSSMVARSNKRDFINDLVKLHKHENTHNTYYAISMLLNSVGTFRDINWFDGFSEDESVKIARSIMLYKNAHNIFSAPDNYFSESYIYSLRYLPLYHTELLFSKIQDLYSAKVDPLDKVEQTLYQLEKSIYSKKLDINKSSALGVLLSYPEIAICVMNARREMCKLLKIYEYDLTKLILELSMQRVDIAPIIGGAIPQKTFIHLITADTSMIVNEDPKDVLKFFDKFDEHKVESLARIIKLATHNEYHFS
jgi:hypothetical protein